MPLRACLMIALALTTACSKTPEQEAVLVALEEAVAAVDSGSMATLWEVSAESARAEVLALHDTALEAMGAIDEVYPAEQREQARAAVGRDLVADIETDDPERGPKLLGRLIARTAVRIDEASRDGLASARATIDGDQAVLHTPAGETFTFVRVGSRWAPRLIEDMLAGHRAVEELRANARAVMAARESHRTAWRESRDPRTPQGAYNLARASLDGPEVDAPALHALLDDEARGVLREALEVAREAQKVLQRGLKKRDRPAAYAAAGLTLHVEADSDRSLYEAWARSEGWVPPLADRSAPAHVEGEASGGQVVVKTSGGGSIPMIRDAKGFWHLGGQGPALAKALVLPAKAALPAPPPGGAAPPGP